MRKKFWETIWERLDLKSTDQSIENSQTFEILVSGFYDTFDFNGMAAIFKTLNKISNISKHFNCNKIFFFKKRNMIGIMS